MVEAGPLRKKALTLASDSREIPQSIPVLLAEMPESETASTPKLLQLISYSCTSSGGSTSFGRSTREDSVLVLHSYSRVSLLSLAAPVLWAVIHKLHTGLVQVNGLPQGLSPCPYLSQLTWQVLHQGQKFSSDIVSLG